MKTCTKCGTAKPFTEFSKDGSKRDGLCCSCKSCVSDYSAKYAANNREKISARNKTYREAHPDKVRASKISAYKANPQKYHEMKKKWSAANPVKAKEIKIKWANANREKMRSLRAACYAANPLGAKTRNEKWRSANPEAVRIFTQNRRARNRVNGGRLSSDIAVRLYKLQRGKCACGCGQPLGDDYHRDHIMPIALGGTNTDDNIQLLRQRCNNQKHAKHPIDFMQSRGFLL